MALKKWAAGDRVSALFSTTHKDRTGGGELYAHQICRSLSKVADVRYFTGNTGPLNPEFYKFHGSRFRFTATAMIHETDIFVACSHFQIPPPAGRHRNLVVTFFPNPAHAEMVKKYDTVITCSEFSAKWVKKYWGKTAKVIYPYIDLTQYRADLEKAPNTILSVGRFFREPHGHSKKQHILLEAFAKVLERNPDFVLVLAGAVHSPSDGEYLDFCKDRARSLGVEGKCEFYPNVDFDELRRLYTGAEFYWHANGYESDNPYETEHFGIVIAEAMASGCTPIIFRAGGFQDFPVKAWSTPAELAQLTLKAKHDPVGMRRHVETHFTESQMDADVKDVLFRRTK